MLAYCWSAVLDDGLALSQRWFNISCLLDHPTALHRPDANTTLEQRRRLWASIEPTVGQRILFTG